MSNAIANGLKFFALTLTFSFSLSACSVKTKEETTATPVNGSGDANGNDPTSVEAMTLGEVNTAKGDVLKDENEMFSLTRVYSLKLAEATQLQVRKSFANGNCGSPTGTFIFLKGEEAVANVTIDPNKEYQGTPLEKLPAALDAGDYTVAAFITLDQECKSMMFYYEFFVEQVK